MWYAILDASIDQPMGVMFRPKKEDFAGESLLMEPRPIPTECQFLFWKSLRLVFLGDPLAKRLTIAAVLQLGWREAAGGKTKGDGRMLYEFDDIHIVARDTIRRLREARTEKMWISKGLEQAHVGSEKILWALQRLREHSRIAYGLQQESSAAA